MARTRVRQTTTRTTRTRVNRNNTSGYRVCNMCHGTGRVKKK